MKYSVRLSGPALVNPAVHAMAVIVTLLFAFHFARLAGFSATAVLAALTVASLAAASTALRRTLTVDAVAQEVTTTVSLFSFPLSTRTEKLPGMAWAGVRADLPDLVIEIGTPGGEAVEIQRFKNAYATREREVGEACARMARALHLEVRV